MPAGPILKLYVKPGCPWCMQAIAWLDEQGYEYREIDVIADESAFEEMKALSRQGLAPTLVVDGGPEIPQDDSGNGPARNVLPDFGIDDLKIFLAQHEIAPAVD